MIINSAAAFIVALLSTDSLLCCDYSGRKGRVHKLLGHPKHDGTDGTSS